MIEMNERERILDEEHLRLLSIGYMVSAGATAFFSFFALFYVCLGLFFVFFAPSMPSRPGQDMPPAALGWVFVVVGALVFVFMVLVAALKFHASRCLKRRTSRLFCMVIAGLCCLAVPYGTLLGVFTFLVLSRASVRVLFESPNASR
jgi:hypothetical protein